MTHPSERKPQQDSIDLANLIVGIPSLVGLGLEIAGQMIAVKDFPMPKGRRNVVTGEIVLPIEKDN